MTRWLMLISSLDERDGGPPRAVLRISEALVEAGDAVVVVAAREPIEVDGPSLLRAAEAGVLIHRGTVRRRTRFRFSWSMARAAYHASANVDVVCLHSFYQFTSVLAWLLSRRRGIPLLVQPHGVFEPYQEAHGRRHKQLLMRIIGRRIVRGTRAVLVCSSLEERGVADTLAVLDPACTIVGLGVDAPVVTRTRHEPGRRLLFLSRVAPKKRLDLVLHAVSELASCGTPVTLSVCGDGDDRLIEQLKRIAVPRGSVIWNGHVVGDAVAIQLATHDLLVLPSDNENYGMAVTEALAAGLPVVTTSQTGAGEHVSRAGAGWVLHDPTATTLADTISSALADPDGLVAMGARANAYAESELTWAAVAVRWRALIAVDGESA